MSLHVRLVKVKEMKTAKQTVELEQSGDIPSIFLINYH